jgi:O-acetyl-ADP-ribose deacetylase (regulator of RNase III)
MFSRIRSWFRRSPRLEIVRGDITTLEVDAIVNAAKSSLLGGGGVDGAIHEAAGPQLLEECMRLRAAIYPHGLCVGEAAVTGGGKLPAMYVIHTVGPHYRKEPDPALLRACYTNSLAAADRLKARSVAFPLISSGVYAWPVGDAIHQAITAIQGARTSVRDIKLVTFDAHTYTLAKAILAGRPGL